MMFKKGDRVQVGDGKVGHIKDEQYHKFFYTVCGISSSIAQSKPAPADFPLCKKCQKIEDKEKTK
jgi:hypothetical protein